MPAMRSGSTIQGPETIHRPRGRARWIAACAVCAALGYGAGAASRSEPARTASAAAAPAGDAPNDSRSGTMAARRLPPEAPAPAARQEALDPRPDPEDVEAMVAWKQRQLARNPPQGAAAVSPAVKASQELVSAVERERGVLVRDCWDAQAPEDREGPTSVKFVVDVDGVGRIGEVQAFEIPETRRPEFVECVRNSLAQAAPSLSPPGTSLRAAALVPFP